MPSRFISRTTSSPNGDRPLCLRRVGRGVGPVERLGVRQRHVAHAQACSTSRSTPSELSMEWPPSTPISEAILPALADAHDVVGAVGQLERVRVAAGDHRWMTSICSSVVADGGALLGRSRPGRRRTRTAPRRRPSRSRGMSVWSAFCGLVQVDVAERQAVLLAELPGQVVVAVDQSASRWIASAFSVRTTSPRVCGGFAPFASPIEEARTTSRMKVRVRIGSIRRDQIVGEDTIAKLAASGKRRSSNVARLSESSKDRRDGRSPRSRSEIGISGSPQAVPSYNTLTCPPSRLAFSSCKESR